jgi:hypothetical protein
MPPFGMSRLSNDCLNHTVVSFGVNPKVKHLAFKQACGHSLEKPGELSRLRSTRDGDNRRTWSSEAMTKQYSRRVPDGGQFDEKH